MKNETDNTDVQWWIPPLFGVGMIALIGALFYCSFGNEKGGITVPIWRAPLHIEKRTIDGHEYIAIKGGNITHSASCTNHISTGLQ